MYLFILISSNPVLGIILPWEIPTYLTSAPYDIASAIGYPLNRIATPLLTKESRYFGILQDSADAFLQTTDLERKIAQIQDELVPVPEVRPLNQAESAFWDVYDTVTEPKWAVLDALYPPHVIVLERRMLNSFYLSLLQCSENEEAPLDEQTYTVINANKNGVEWIQTFACPPPPPPGLSEEEIERYIRSRPKDKRLGRYYLDRLGIYFQEKGFGGEDATADGTLLDLDGSRRTPFVDQLGVFSF